MVKTIYAVFDRKTNSVEFIQQAENLDVFQRWFANVFLTAGSMSMFSRFPEDYDIYSLCTYDTETLEGEKSWSPHVLTSVSAIIDHYHLARPDMARSSDEA